jgi:hypothetical protein
MNNAECRCQPKSEPLAHVTFLEKNLFLIANNLFIKVEVVL